MPGTGREQRSGSIDYQYEIKDRVLKKKEIRGRLGWLPSCVRDAPLPEAYYWTLHGMTLYNPSLTTFGSCDARGGRLAGLLILYSLLW